MFLCCYQLVALRLHQSKHFVDTSDDRIVQVLELILERDGTMTKWPPDILTPSDIKA
jgi:hypothetical protein